MKPKIYQKLNQHLKVCARCKHRYDQISSILSSTKQEVSISEEELSNIIERSRIEASGSVNFLAILRE